MITMCLKTWHSPVSLFFFFSPLEILKRKRDKCWWLTLTAISAPLYLGRCGVGGEWMWEERGEKRNKGRSALSFFEQLNSTHSSGGFQQACCHKQRLFYMKNMRSRGLIWSWQQWNALRLPDSLLPSLSLPVSHCVSRPLYTIHFCLNDVCLWEKIKMQSNKKFNYCLESCLSKPWRQVTSAFDSVKWSNENVVRQHKK